MRLFVRHDPYGTKFVRPAPYSRARRDVRPAVTVRAFDRSCVTLGSADSRTGCTVAGIDCITTHDFPERSGRRCPVGHVGLEGKRRFVALGGACGEMLELTLEYLVDHFVRELESLERSRAKPLGRPGIPDEVGL